MSDTEQQGVSPTSAGGASAPDFNAIRDAVLDSLRAVPLWQFRKGLVAAGLIPADVEIQAADRKPVHGEPGIQAEWDEDTDAMRVDGIGWDLSFGCKVSFAYDPAQGEHYVCVSTSDADQRAGITSRRTTKEQLASLGQHLLNVFGEPDPRDAELERLRDEIHNMSVGHEATMDYVARQLANMLETDESTLVGDLLGLARVALRERDQYRAERDREHAGLGDVCVALHEAVSDYEECAVFSRDHALHLVQRLAAERDRLRQELDLIGENSGQAENDLLRAELDFVAAQHRQAETEATEMAAALARIQQTLTAVDRCPHTTPPAEPRRWVAGDAEDLCDAGNEDYPELRCKRAAGHWGSHEDPTQGATWSVEVAANPKDGA